MSITNSRNNIYQSDGRIISLEYNFNNNITLGNVTVNSLAVLGTTLIYGNLTTLDTLKTNIKDNIILLNDNQTAAGVALNLSGLEIDRGTLTNAQIVWNESTASFRIGLKGTTSNIATIQDTPVDSQVFVWNATSATSGYLANTTSVYISAISSSNLSTTNLSSATLNLTSSTVSNMTISNLIATTLTNVNFNVSNLTDNNISINNFIGTNVSTTNLYSSTSNFTLSNVNLTNVSGSNIYAQNSTITNALITNLSTNNFVIPSANINNLAFTNESTSNLVSSNLLNSTMNNIINTTITNLIATNLTSTFFSISSCTIQNANITNISTSTMMNTNLTGTNLISTNISAGDSLITNFNTTNLSSGSLNSTNVSISNIFVSSLSQTNAVVTNLTSVNMNSTNILNTGTTLSNAVITNETVVNSNQVNSSIGTLLSTNLTITNLNATNLTIPSFITTNLTITNSTLSNANISNISSTSFSITNATFTNLTTTNLNVTNATMTNLQLPNSVISNITTTNLIGTSATVSNMIISVNNTVVNLNTTSQTIGNLVVVNKNSTTSSISNLLLTNGTLSNINTVQSATLNNLVITNMSVPTLIGTSVTGSNMNLTNGLIPTATIANLLNTNTTLTNLILVNDNTTNLTCPNNILSNSTITSLNTTNMNITNMSGTNNVIVNATIPNPLLVNLISTNVTSTNTTLVNSTFTNMAITNTTLTNVLTTNNTTTNLLNTNTTITNLNATNSSIQNALITALTATNVIVTNETATNVMLNNTLSINTLSMTGTGGSSLIFNNIPNSIGFTSSNTSFTSVNTQVILQGSVGTFTSNTSPYVLLGVNSYIPIQSASITSNNNIISTATSQGVSINLNKFSGQYDVANSSTASTLFSNYTSATWTATGNVTISNSAATPLQLYLSEFDKSSVGLYYTNNQVTVGTNLTTGLHTLSFTNSNYLLTTSGFLAFTLLANTVNQTIASGNTITFSNLTLTINNTPSITYGSLLNSSISSTSGTFSVSTQTISNSAINNTTTNLIIAPNLNIPITYSGFTVNSNVVSGFTNGSNSLSLVLCGLSSGPFATLGSFNISTASQTFTSTGGSLILAQSPFYVELVELNTNTNGTGIVQTSLSNISFSDSNNVLGLGSSFISETNGTLYANNNVVMNNCSVSNLNIPSATANTLTLTGNSSADFIVSNIMPICNIGTVTQTNITAQLSTGSSFTQGIALTSISSSGLFVFNTSGNSGTQGTTFTSPLLQNNSAGQVFITGDILLSKTGSTVNNLSPMTLNLTSIDKSYNRTIANLSTITGITMASSISFLAEVTTASTSLPALYFNIAGQTSSGTTDASVCSITMNNLQISPTSLISTMSVGAGTSATLMYSTQSNFHMVNTNFLSNVTVNNNLILNNSFIPTPHDLSGNASIGSNPGFLIRWNITGNGQVLTMPSNVPEGYTMNIIAFNGVSATSSNTFSGNGTFYSSSGGAYGSTFPLNFSSGFTFLSFIVTRWNGLNTWVVQPSVT